MRCSPLFVILWDLYTFYMECAACIVQKHTYVLWTEMF